MKKCLYCNGTGVVPKDLTEDVEVKIIRLYNSESEREIAEAKELLCQAAGRLISAIASSVQTKGSYLDREDIEQEGYCILLEAIRRYDATRGIKIVSFVTPAIRRGSCQAVVKARGNTEHYAKAATKVLSAMLVICAERGVDPCQITDKELAEATGLSIVTIKEAREGMLASPASMSSEEALAQTTGPKKWEPEHNYISLEEEGMLMWAIESLPEDQKLVFLAIADEKKSVREVRELLRYSLNIKTTSQGVRDIYNRAREALMRMLKD